MTIMLRSSSLHVFTMLVMSETLSSVGTQLWLLLPNDVLDDATSTRWDSEVRQLRKKKSPQGVEELMIYTDTAARGEEKSLADSTHRPKNSRMNVSTIVSTTAMLSFSWSSPSNNFLFRGPSVTHCHRFITPATEWKMAVLHQIK